MSYKVIHDSFVYDVKNKEGRPISKIINDLPLRLPNNIYNKTYGGVIQTPSRHYIVECTKNG